MIVRQTWDNLPSNELGLERCDDIADVAGKLCQQWDDRFILGHTDLLDHYLNGKIGLQIRFSCLGFEPHKYFASFNGPSQGDLVLPAMLDGDSWREIKITIPSADEKPCHDEKPVLVGVVELLQNPEGVCLSGTASVERLELLDPCCRAGTHTLYHSPTTGFVSVYSGEDGKSALARGDKSASDNQLPNQMIKGRTLLIEDFADENIKLKRQGNLVHKNKREKSRLLVVMLRASGGVLVKVILQGLFKFEDLLIGPFDLSLASG